jgi:hypothetical protein
MQWGERGDITLTSCFTRHFAAAIHGVIISELNQPKIGMNTRIYQRNLCHVHQCLSYAVLETLPFQELPVAVRLEDYLLPVPGRKHGLA